MTPYPFFKMAVGSHIGFDLGNIRPSRKCYYWSQLDPQIYSFGDFCDIHILPFWLEIA